MDSLVASANIPHGCYSRIGARKKGGSQEKRPGVAVRLPPPDSRASGNVALAAPLFLLGLTGFLLLLGLTGFLLLAFATLACLQVVGNGLWSGAAPAPWTTLRSTCATSYNKDTPRTVRTRVHVAGTNG